MNRLLRQDRTGLNPRGCEPRGSEGDEKLQYYFHPMYFDSDGEIITR